MSERKVLNKYYPPDFDPAKIPRRKGLGGPRQYKVRLMAPFSMRCETCGEYIYKGKKFNARKEDAQGEKYYSIQIYRFYIRCPRCAAEITFKTDPKNLDYACEHGASRNFEPWRDDSVPLVEQDKNPIKELEARTMDSKREMEIMDALDEIRTRNSRQERVDLLNVLEKLEGPVAEQARATVLELEELELDKLAKDAFSSPFPAKSHPENDEDDDLVEVLDGAALVRQMMGLGSTFSASPTAPPAKKPRNLPEEPAVVIIKKKPAIVTAYSSGSDEEDG